MDVGSGTEGDGATPADGRWARARLAEAVFAELRRLGVVMSACDRPRPFAVVAGDGRLVAGNRPLFELLGRPEADVLGTAWSSHVPRWTAPDGPTAEEDVVEMLVSAARERSGRPVAAKMTAHPVRAQDGDVVAHTVFVLPLDDGPPL